MLLYPAPYNFAYISPVKEVELSFLVDVLDYILLSPHFSGSSRDRKTFEVEVESSAVSGAAVNHGTC